MFYAFTFSIFVILNIKKALSLFASSNSEQRLVKNFNEKLYKLRNTSTHVKYKYIFLGTLIENLMQFLNSKLL